MRLKFAVSLAIGLILTFAVQNITAFSKDYNNLVDNCLRLHIIADSNETGAQNAKFILRDALLSEYDFSKFTDKNDAEKFIAENKKKMTAFCNKVTGADCRINIEKDWFERRRYDGFTLPAGYYNALKISIGKSAGDNWWCVVFPPLCAEIAGDKSETALTSVQEDIITKPQKYRVKLAFVEWLERLFHGR